MTARILPYDFDPGFMPICNRECPRSVTVDDYPPAYSCRFYCVLWSVPCERYEAMVATWKGAAA